MVRSFITAVPRRLKPPSTASVRLDGSGEGLTARRSHARLRDRAPPCSNDERRSSTRRRSRALFCARVLFAARGNRLIPSRSTRFVVTRGPFFLKHKGLWANSLIFQNREFELHEQGISILEQRYVCHDQAIANSMYPAGPFFASAAKPIPSFCDEDVFVACGCWVW